MFTNKKNLRLNFHLEYKQFLMKVSAIIDKSTKLFYEYILICVFIIYENATHSCGA